VISCNRPRAGIKMDTVGPPLKGVEVRIAPDGEVLTRSGGVFQGYFRNPEATAQTVDADGWLHTGDVGVLDDDGFLKITDRKKDILITAGGKNIAPSEIENALKVSPYVREAIVLGAAAVGLLVLLRRDDAPGADERAAARLIERAETIKNPAWRRAFLEDVEESSRTLSLVRAWRLEAGA